MTNDRNAKVWKIGDWDLEIGIWDLKCDIIILPHNRSRGDSFNDILLHQ